MPDLSDIERLQGEAIEKARELVLDMGPDSWFDFWHRHLDWHGVGNESLAARRPFLEALFILFDRLEQQAKAYPHFYQLWVYLEEKVSSQDAVYLHARNPNADNFPLKLDFVDFEAEWPEWLLDFVQTDRHVVGRSNDKGVDSYHIFLK